MHGGNKSKSYFICSSWIQGPHRVHTVKKTKLFWRSCSFFWAPEAYTGGLLGFYSICSYEVQSKSNATVSITSSRIIWEIRWINTLFSSVYCQQHLDMLIGDRLTGNQSTPLTPSRITALTGVRYFIAGLITARKSLGEHFFNDWSCFWGIVLSQLNNKYNYLPH